MLCVSFANVLDGLDVPRDGVVEFVSEGDL